jgi:hypothetical protein
MTSPAPDSDSEPRCWSCQSFAAPSSALYWHIGGDEPGGAATAMASRACPGTAAAMQRASVRCTRAPKPSPATTPRTAERISASSQVVGKGAVAAIAA